MCPHGGIGHRGARRRPRVPSAAPRSCSPPTRSNRRLRVPAPGTPHPCVQVQWIDSALRAARGAQPLTTDSVGLCHAADRAVQGPVMIQATQAQGGRAVMIRHDYAYPLRIDASAGQLARAAYAAHVDQLIRQLLLTSPGERVCLPEFGCGLRRLVFAPQSDALAATVRIQVQQAIDRWLATRWRWQNVNVLSGADPGNGLDEGALLVTVNYTLVDTQTRGEPDGAGDADVPDRLADLLASTTLNGIDFVEITAPTRPALRVHFLNHGHRRGHAGRHRPGHDHRRRGGAVRAGAAGRGHRLGCRRRGPADAGAAHRLPRRLLVLPAAHRQRRARPLLRRRPVHVQGRLPVHARLRGPGGAACRPARRRRRLIDYLAKDFASFRAALLDYSAPAYPQWVERDEPDLGMVLVELLSAAGDDLSYLQDRIAAEATLATATQRGSVVRHARLVDYEPRPGHLGPRARCNST